VFGQWSQTGEWTDDACCPAESDDCGENDPIPPQCPLEGPFLVDGLTSGLVFYNLVIIMHWIS